MSQEDNEEFRLRDKIAFRVIEHLITNASSELTIHSSEDKIDNIARMAYMMANAMCKQRLAAFT